MRRRYGSKSRSWSCVARRCQVRDANWLYRGDTRWPLPHVQEQALGKRYRRRRRARHILGGIIRPLQPGSPWQRVRESLPADVDRAAAESRDPHLVTDQLKALSPDSYGRPRRPAIVRAIDVRERVSRIHHGLPDPLLLRNSIDEL